MGRKHVVKETVDKDAQRWRKKFAEFGIKTYVDISEQTGIPYATVRGLFSGRYGPGNKTRKIIENFLSEMRLKDKINNESR